MAPTSFGRLRVAAHPPSRPRIPVRSDRQGRVYFLGLKGPSPERAQIELTRAALKLQ